MKFIRNRLLQHLAFWAGAYYVLLRIFAAPSGIQKIDLIYAGAFLITLLPGIYLNLLLLVPRFLSRGKYVAYSGLLLAVLLATAGFNMLTFSKLIDYILPGYYFISYYEYTDLLKFVLVFVAVTSLLKLSRGWFLLAEARHQLISLQKENAETRLAALRNQVNPHFLFNSLAGIYSLVLKQAPNAPGVVLKLSDFLRYVLYEASADEVSLQKELDSMRDYVELQKLRAGTEASIELDMPSECEKGTIAPLLFLPLAENCFKHGIKGATGPVFAKISFKTESGRVSSVFENSMGRASGSEKGGIGLENLKKRLDLLYPGIYRLEIKNETDRFRVELDVPLKRSRPVEVNSPHQPGGSKAGKQ
jgi:hypothetical protein